MHCLTTPDQSRRGSRFVGTLALLLGILSGWAFTNEPAAGIPADGGVAPQASAQTVLDAARRLGVPFEPSLEHELTTATDSRALWQAIRPHTLLEVELNPEMRVKVSAGSAETRLVVAEPRAYFVRIDNTCGATARLTLSASDLAVAGAGTPHWLDLEMVDRAGCSDRLSGAPVEYKLLICTAHEGGRREARLALDAGQGTQDLGFRGVADILFHVRPADGSPLGE